MIFMRWSDHFKTGCDPVDAQHRVLVDMINEAAPHLVSGGEEAQRVVKPLLDKLVDYTLTHFKFEEDLMRSLGVVEEYASEHTGIHQSFVNKLVQLRRAFEAGADDVGGEMVRFLASWLTFHILSEDKRLTLQVRAIEGGETPQNAHRTLQNTSPVPSAALIESFVDLFSELNQHHQQLMKVHEELSVAKSALEAANAQLEARVQERTGELVATSVTLTESLNKLERTQGQLLQSEKMAAVGQLAAGVAHEINNPIGFVNSNLGSLSGYVEQLFLVIRILQQACTALEPAQRAALEASLKQVDLDYLREDVPDLLNESKEGLARVKRIVSDLRDFAHVDEPQWVPADINHTLESALNMAANELKYKAQVVRELGTLPPVTCIAGQLNQVFVNLLVNAAQAIAEKGQISVRTGHEGAHVWIEIADSGRGMSAEVQKRIFEPFFTTKPVGQGTGLGLSISWEIIQRHGGTIEVHSEPGQGTRFRITLPIEHAA